LEYKWLINNKYISSPDRLHYAGFFCNWDIDKFQVFGIILDKNKNEIKNKEIINVKPYEGEFIYYVKTKWEDNNTFILYDKLDGKWSINVEDRIVK